MQLLVIGLGGSSLTSNQGDNGEVLLPGKRGGFRGGMGVSLNHNTLFPVKF